MRFLHLGLLSFSGKLFFEKGLFFSPKNKKESFLHFFNLGMESDDEIRRVPEIGGEAAGASASGRNGGSVARPVQQSVAGPRKRGRSPADKENKRLRR